jgi:hypothetical protein
MGEGTFFARFRYALPITITAASLQLHDVPQMNYVPSKNYDLPNFRLMNYPWEDSYIPSTVDFSLYPNGIEVIQMFATNLLEEMVDIPPEFSRVIDENFWDLI